MQRVMIVGQPGSGKSRLAQALGARTGLPVVHIDTIHWQPGWVERSFNEKTRLCHEVELAINGYLKEVIRLPGTTVSPGLIS